MKTLKLGDKFNTKNVKDMYKMFLDCGYTEMTTIDLGPAFVYIQQLFSCYIPRVFLRISANILKLISVHRYIFTMPLSLL